MNSKYPQPYDKSSPSPSRRPRRYSTPSPPPNREHNRYDSSYRRNHSPSANGRKKSPSYSKNNYHSPRRQSTPSPNRRRQNTWTNHTSHGRRSPSPSRRPRKYPTPSPPPNREHNRHDSHRRRYNSPSANERKQPPIYSYHNFSPPRRQHHSPPPSPNRRRDLPNRRESYNRHSDGLYGPMSRNILNSDDSFYHSKSPPPRYDGSYQETEQGYHVPKTSYRRNNKKNRGGKGDNRTKQRSNTYNINSQNPNIIKHSTDEYIFPNILSDGNKNWSPLNYDSVEKLCEIAQNAELPNASNAVKQANDYLAKLKHFYDSGDMEACFLNALLYIKVCDYSTIPNNIAEQAVAFVSNLHPILQKRYAEKEEETAGASALITGTPQTLYLEILKNTGLSLNNLFTRFGLNGNRSSKTVTDKKTDTEDDRSEEEEQSLGYLGSWRQESNGDGTGGVIGGHNKDNKEIYVARITHNGAVIPGKYLPYLKTCYSSAKGEEIKNNKYELLCEEKGKRIKWIEWSSNKKYIKDAAIIGGISGGNPLYIGRVKHGSSITCGKVDSKTRKLYVVFGGKEHIFKDYELLVVKNIDDGWKTVKDKQKFVSLFKSNKESDKSFKKTKDTEDDDSSDEKSSSKTKTTNNRTEYKSRNDQSGGKQKEFELKTLPSTDKDYQYVSALFKSSLSSVTIKSIEKVWNTKLYSDFHHRKIKIERELGEGKANVKNLFHGSAHCKTIATKGFDERYAVKGAYGHGLYFAKAAKVSDEYSGCDLHKKKGCQDCPRMMLLCSVVLGTSGTSTGAASRPGIGQHSLKTLIGNNFIVPRGEQAFPAYIITYE